MSFYGQLVTKCQFIDHIPNIFWNYKSLTIKERLFCEEIVRRCFHDFLYQFSCWNAELQKLSILVSRILDISGRKSGHFQIVAANLSIFGMKRLQHCWFMEQFKSKCINLRRKFAFVQYHVSCCVQIQKIQFWTFFSWKLGYRTKKVFLQLWAEAVGMDPRGRQKHKMKKQIKHH